MKNFLKNNWFKICKLLITITITSGSFYLLIWEPRRIIKECYKTMISQMKGKNLSNDDIRLFLDICLLNSALTK